MAQCVTSATATRTNLQTTESLSTSFSEVVTTLPPTVSSVTVTSCLIGATPSGCVVSTEIVSTTTIPGATQTSSVPVVTTIPITNSETITLFGTSCPVDPPPSSDPPQQSASQSESTMPNGVLTTVMVTITNTPPVPSGGTSSAPVVQQTGDTGGSSTNLGAIIGGSVAGVAGLIGIVLVIWFILKRRRRWDDIFDKEDDNIIAHTGRAERFSLTADIEPKPYQYGLVGTTSPHSTSPPHSPPMHPQDISTAYNPFPGAASDLQHRKNRPSISPLETLPLGMMSAGPTPTTTSMTHSRPSTSGSMQPLTGPQQPFYPPPPQQQPYINARTPSSHASHPSSHTHSQSGSYNSPPLQPQFMSWSSPDAVVNPPSEQQGYFGSQDYRAGSPQSFNEPPPRRLQVTNHDTRMSMNSLPDTAIPTSSPTRQSYTIAEEDPYAGYMAYAGGSNATPATPTHSNSLSLSQGDSDTRARDEKTRLRVNNSSTPAPPQQEGASSSNAAAGDPPPPAYSA